MIRVFSNRIAVKRRKDVERRTDGGLFIPTTSDGVVEAIVVAAGDTSGVTVGDRILMGAYAGEIVQVDGKQVSVIKSDDVICAIGVPGECRGEVP